MSFRQASTVTHADDGRWCADIARGWDIVGNANGGYVLATAARAMSAAADRPDPLTITAHYLRPVTVGPVDIATEVVRSGRRVSTVRGRLERDGAPLVEFLGAFGDLTATTGDPDVARYSITAPPLLPPVEECFGMATDRSEERSDSPPEFTSRVAMYLHPDDAAFASGSPSGVARIRGWFRLAHDEPLDTLALLLSGRCLPADDLQCQPPHRVDTDDRADRARPPAAGRRVAALCVRDQLCRRRGVGRER